MPSNIVLFVGYDASDDFGLWVTDGTAAGTHELTGIVGAGKGADSVGAAESFVDLDHTPPFVTANLFTLSSGEAWFGGYDTSGQVGLWESDGTAASTHELTGDRRGGVNGIRPV